MVDNPTIGEKRLKASLVYFMGNKLITNEPTFADIAELKQYIKRNPNRVDFFVNTAESLLIELMFWSDSPKYDYFCYKLNNRINKLINHLEKQFKTDSLEQYEQAEVMLKHMYEHLDLESFSSYILVGGKDVSFRYIAKRKKILFDNNTEPSTT